MIFVVRYVGISSQSDIGSVYLDTLKEVLMTRKRKKMIKNLKNHVLRFNFGSWDREWEGLRWIAIGFFLKADSEKE